MSPNFYSWNVLTNTLSASAPTAVSWGLNRIDVFWVNLNTGSMMHKWYANSWSGDEDLGGYLIGAPVAVSRGANLLDIFGVSSDYGIYKKSFNPTSGWSAWVRIGGTVTTKHTSVGAVAMGTSQLDVYYSSSDNTLYRLTSLNSGSTWGTPEVYAVNMDIGPVSVVKSPSSTGDFILVTRRSDGVILLSYLMAVPVLGTKVWKNTGGAALAGTNPVIVAEYKKLHIYVVGTDGNCFGLDLPGYNSVTMGIPAVAEEEAKNNGSQMNTTTVSIGITIGVIGLIVIVVIVLVVKKLKKDKSQPETF
jgi:hypothetical protein